MDVIFLALALEWLVRDRWLLRSYHLKNLGTGEVSEEDWWVDPGDIPPSSVSGNVDIVTNFVKTVRFGK